MDPTINIPADLAGLDAAIKQLSNTIMQSRLKNDLHANHSHGTDNMSCTDCSASLYDQLDELFWRKYKITKSENDREGAELTSGIAVDLAKSIIMGAIEGKDDRAREFVIKLANYLGKKGRRFEKAEDINEAIICYEKALADYGPESELGAANLLNYAKVLRVEVDGGEGPRDINKAILLATTAKSLAEQNSDAILPEICSDLAEMYDTRSEKSDSLDDLILAANFAKQAVDGTPPDAGDFVVRSWTYANCLCALFERSGDRHYINKAINALDEAEEASDSYIDVAVRAGFRTSFAKALELRYTDTHNLTDLKYAIENAKKAVKYAEETEDTNIIAAFLGNLAMLLGEYSSVTEEMEDLDQAISVGRQALEAQESHQVLCLHNLAMMLADRCERAEASTDQNSIDLLEAFKLSCEAIEIPGADHIMMATLHHGLGRALQLLFTAGIAKENQYLRDAVEREASQPSFRPVGVSSDGDTMTVALQFGSSRTLRRLFDAGIMKDNQCLREAITHCQKAVDMTSKNMTFRNAYLMQLGDLYREVFKIEGKEDDFRHATLAYTEAREIEAASLFNRLAASDRNGQLHEESGRWLEASHYYEDAVKLVPQTVLDALDLNNQRRILTELSPLAAKAASMILQAGRPASTAFEVLEIGRGVIANISMRDQDDLRRLKDFGDKGKQLWLKYAEYSRTALERTEKLGWMQVLEGPEYESGHPTLTSERLSRATEMMALENDIRHLPGFDRFRMPLTESQIKNLAKDGPIVAIVASERRSDALIVTAEGIRSIKLDSLKWDDIVEYITFMLVGTGMKVVTLDNFYDVNKELKQLLRWLWFSTVLPVLKELNFYPTKFRTSLPRIRWLSVGKMGFFPFHAAGEHENNSSENTLNYAISSYATNAKALAWSLAQSRKCPWSHNLPAVFVGMPETPDWPPLGGVEDQLDALRGFTTRIEHLNKPSGYRVVQELPKSSIAHFVCHGISNHKNPHNSCLVLYNNMTDQTNALNISDISRLQLSRAKLAYLSACETADSASIKLVDENIQFASMFQTAGYPHIIATFWKAEMRASTKMAKAFYRNLAKGIDKEGEEVVARAFHNAVLEVRAEDPDEPVTWAAFVYFGV